MVGKFNAKPVKMNDNGEVVACVFGESENKGTPFVGMEFEIVDGEHKGERRYPWRGWLTGAASDRTAQALVACGFTGDDISAYPEQSPSNVVQIVLEEEDYEGNTTTRVAWVNAPRQVKRLTGSSMKQLGASLKSIIAASRAGTQPEEKPTETKTAKKNKAPF